MIDRWFCVACDRCKRPCGGSDDLQPSIEMARAYAKRVGWKRIGLTDVCPKCQ